MLLNSYIFILCFLPAVVILYFLLSRWSAKAGQIGLIVLSLLFYAYGGLKMLAMLAVDIVVNFIFVREILAAKGNGKKVVLFFGITANILLLLYCKYLNLFLTTAGKPTMEILVPLGVSFFTFQQISYLVDSYRDKTRNNTLLEYILYVVYFPKIIMGPITKQENLLPQFRNPENRRLNPDHAVKGLQRFTLGLAKKVLLAETFATMVSYIHYYQNAGMATTTEILLLAVGYSLEIYFDFSGYSDMAIGVSLILNIQLTENFNSPHKAISIRDFWKRWHLSLTKFLTEYLYIPLGGSRKGTARTYLNTMIVFLVSGFWHGANWTYALWGFLHGGISILERAGDRFLQKIPKPVRWILTFLVGIILWILFQAESIEDFASALTALFTSGDFTVHDSVFTAFELAETKGLIRFFGWAAGASAAAVSRAVTISGYVMLPVFFILSYVICLGMKNTTEREYNATPVSLILSVLLLVWCVTSLGSESMFVYNNF